MLLNCNTLAHMLCNQNYFMTYRTVSNKSIAMGDVQGISIVGMGLVLLHCRLSSEIRMMILHSTLHVLSLSANLVSLETIQRVGTTH